MGIGDISINPFNWSKEEAQNVGDFGAYLSGFHWGTVREQIIPIEHHTKEVVLTRLKGPLFEYPAFDVVVKDKTTGREVPLAKARLYVTPDGEALVHGPYTKEIHAGLSKLGIKRPTSYFIDAKRFQFLPDEILYGEFDNLFLETPSGTSYRPANFHFFNSQSETFFQRVASRFFGDDAVPDRASFQERWRGPEGHLWGPRLGGYQMVEGSIRLRGGFELEPSGTFQNWWKMNPDFNNLRDLTFYRPEERINPPEFREGEVVIVETKGQAAPRSIEAKTTHRLLHLKGPDRAVTTIAQEVSRTVYNGVNTFLITHLHADHLDPVTMIKQLEHNKGRGGTTLILGEEVKAGVLHTVAEYDGWVPDNHMGTAQAFLTKKYGITVVPEITVGDLVVRATPDVLGAHGVPVNGVGIFRKMFDPGEVAPIPDDLLYYDPSDGDYNIDSLQKQIDDLERKTTRTPAENNQLSRLKKVKEYLLKARYVTVDQGTTGYDTHGTAQTTENLRRERLKVKFGMLDDKARAFSVAFSQDGREGALQALRKLRWEDDATQIRIVEELETVSDTSHLGAGNQRKNVPEYREGRLERIGVDGSRRVLLPRIEQELKKLGLSFVGAGSRLTTPYLVLEVDGAHFYVKDGKEVPKKLAQLMREYSTTTVEKTKSGIVRTNVVTLRQMTITEGRQTRLVGEWLRHKGLYVIVKTAGRPTKTPLGYYDLPQRSVVPGLKSRITYRLSDGIKAGLRWCADPVVLQSTGLPRSMVHSIADFAEDPRLMRIFGPKTAYYSKSLVGGALKYGGPVLMAASLMSVIYINRQGLEYGQADAWAEVLATVAGFGLSLWVFGFDVAATTIIVGASSIYHGSFQEGWASTHDMAMPLSMAFHWAVKEVLTLGLNKVKYAI